MLFQMPVDPDLALRQAAITRVLELREAFGDFVHRDVLRQGFLFHDERIPFSSFQKGIHRARQMRGPAALSLFTTPPKEGKPPPYADDVDEERGLIVYHYRAGSVEQADNRALRAAHDLRTPLIYFKGVSPSRYFPIAPVFVAENDPAERAVLLQVGIPLVDVQPGGPVSPVDARAYALRTVRARLHQQRFRHEVLRAYQHRCTICALRERELVQAAHIVSDPSPEGIAAVVNGLALCAIHHLAYDRNLLGIDSAGGVHIARRLREEHDGPMLREGLQGFHGGTIQKPRLVVEHPDPERLAVRFAAFEAAA
jgi:putative restriction endonuclease